MNREQLRQRIDRAWHDLQASFAGLSDPEMTAPGVVEDWSVKEILAHVTTWEEEALCWLPVVMAGGRPLRYASVGGIDAFNARQTAAKRALSLAEVRQQMEETHQRLLAYLETVPEEHIRTETRFRHRLRLESYGHYAIHSRAIREWREQRRQKWRSTPVPGRPPAAVLRLAAFRDPGTVTRRLYAIEAPRRLCTLCTLYRASCSAHVSRHARTASIAGPRCAPLASSPHDHMSGGQQNLGPPME